MMTLKTRPNDRNFDEFLSTVTPDWKRADALTLLDLFSRITAKAPVMWGDSIVGFGHYTYTNSRGEFSWLMTGFSPRKQNLTLYIMQGFEEFEEELKTLGKVKHAKSCLYINKLADIDMEKLECFLRKVVADMKSRYTCS